MSFIFLIVTTNGVDQHRGAANVLYMYIATDTRLVVVFPFLFQEKRSQLKEITERHNDGHFVFLRSNQSKRWRGLFVP